MKQIEIPSTRAELRAVILDALRRAYTSVSSTDGIETGNHYQSVTLGEEQTKGFRSDRSEFLDRINFNGKRVLDLGSNLGEISRAARSRGARLVDGFEYDQYFVEIAQLVNAYNDTTRVSFFQRDITDPKNYGEHYDIVLAFSVYTYISRVLEQLRAITDDALVIETHKLEGNLEHDYLVPIGRHFPYHDVLGHSDWGRSLSSDESRAVIVFSPSRSALERTLARPDLGPARPALIDVDRTALQSYFFEKFRARGEDLLDEIGKLEIDLETTANKPDLASEVYGGRLYWMLFIKGYLQYAASGRRVGPENLYYNYIIRYYVPRRHDPALCEAMEDPSYAKDRIVSRFRDFDGYRRAPGDYQSPAITIFQSADPRADTLQLFEVNSAGPTLALAVDGWHRLFAARVFGAPAMRAEVVRAHAGP